MIPAARETGLTPWLESWIAAVRTVTDAATVLLLLLAALWFASASFGASLGASLP